MLAYFVSYLLQFTAKVIRIFPLYPIACKNEGGGELKMCSHFEVPSTMFLYALLRGIYSDEDTVIQRQVVMK